MNNRRTSYGAVDKHSLVEQIFVLTIACLNEVIIILHMCSDTCKEEPFVKLVKPDTQYYKGSKDGRPT